MLFRSDVKHSGRIADFAELFGILLVVKGYNIVIIFFAEVDYSLRFLNNVI